MFIVLKDSFLSLDVRVNLCLIIEVSLVLYSGGNALDELLHV